MLRAVLRDGAVYALPAVLSRGLGLILLPIYARMLTSAEFGLLDLILSLGPIVNVLVCLEIQQGLSRLRVDTDVDSRRRMTGSAWLFSTIGYVAFLAVGIALARPLSGAAFGEPGLAGAVRLGMLSLAATALFNMVINQFRWELRSRSYALASSLYALLTVGLTVLLAVVERWGLTGVLTAQCAAGGVSTVIAAIVLRRSWAPALDLRVVGSMLRFSMPLIPASLSVFLTLYFNRMALQSFDGLGAVASYGMAARLAGLVGLLIVGMQSAVTPLVYEHFRDPETPPQLAHLFSAVVGLCILVCLCLNAFSADLLSAIAGERYLSSAPLVALIAPALLMGQLYVFAPGMSVAMKTRQQLAVSATAAVVDIAANVALIPYFGALGAACSTVLSSAVFLGLWIRTSQRNYAIPYERSRLMMALIIFGCGSFASLVARSQLEPLSVSGLAVKTMILLVAFVLLYRTRLFSGALAALARAPKPLHARPEASAIDNS